LVRLALRDRLRALETPSVVRLVDSRAPHRASDKEMEALRACVKRGWRPSLMLI